MSFDLAIWKAARRLDARSAKTTYEALCRGATAGLPLRASKEIDAFYRALTKKYPELGDDDDDACPWAATIDRSSRHLILPMSFSWVKEAVPVVLALAHARALDVFDPQTGALTRHTGAAPPPPKKTPLPGALERQLAARLAALAPKAGFEPQPPGPNVFVAKQRARGGLAHAFVVRSWTRGEVRLFVRVEHDVIGPTIARALGASQPIALVDTPLEEFSRERDGRLLTPKRSRPRSTYATEHVGRAAGAIMADVTRYAVPLFRRLGTLAKLDAFWHGDPESARWRYTTLRPGVEGVEERGVLPVDAFVGVALARAVGRAPRDVVELYEARLSKMVDARWRARQLVRLKAVAAAWADPAPPPPARTRTS